MRRRNKSSWLCESDEMSNHDAKHAWAGFRTGKRPAFLDEISNRINIISLSRRCGRPVNKMVKCHLAIGYSRT